MSRNRRGQKKKIDPDRAMQEGRTVARDVDLDKVRRIVDLIPTEWRGKMPVRVLRSIREMLLSREMTPRERSRILLAPLDEDTEIPLWEWPDDDIACQRLPWHGDGELVRASILSARLARDVDDPPPDRPTRPDTTRPRPDPDTLPPRKRGRKQ